MGVLKLGDTPLEQVESFKYRGVLLSSDLYILHSAHRVNLLESKKDSWSTVSQVLQQH